jgi:DNA-binding MarR family transcriptional regulator
MDLATLMFIAYRAMDEQVVRAVRAAGFEVTFAQGRLAQRIAADGSRLTDLAEQAQVTKQTASLLIAALEREGLVERVPDPADGRARLVRIAERGARSVAVSSRVVAEVEAEWAARLGAARMAELREILTDLREITDPWR